MSYCWLFTILVQTADKNIIPSNQSCLHIIHYLISHICHVFTGHLIMLYNANLIKTSHSFVNCKDKDVFFMVYLNWQKNMKWWKGDWWGCYMMIRFNSEHLRLWGGDIVNIMFINYIISNTNVARINTIHRLEQRDVIVHYWKLYRL